MKSYEMNTDIRAAIKEKGLHHHQIANALRITPGTFSNWLQSELDQEKKEKIFEVIERGYLPETKRMNLQVRWAMEKHGICAYEIANELGIKPGTFAHWMQSELTPERKKRVLQAIRSIKS